MSNGSSFIRIKNKWPHKSTDTLLRLIWHKVIFVEKPWKLDSLSLTVKTGARTTVPREKTLSGINSDKSMRRNWIWKWHFSVLLQDLNLFFSFQIKVSAIINKKCQSFCSKMLKEILRLFWRNIKLRIKFYHQCNKIDSLLCINIFIECSRNTSHIIEVFLWHTIYFA